MAEKLGVTPMTGLLEVSRRISVMVEAATPLATMGPVPVMEEFAMEALLAIKVTVFVTLERAVGRLMERVLVSAVVEAICPTA